MLRGLIEGWPARLLVLLVLGGALWLSAAATLGRTAEAVERRGGRDASRAPADEGGGGL